MLGRPVVTKAFSYALAVPKVTVHDVGPTISTVSPSKSAPMRPASAPFPRFFTYTFHVVSLGTGSANCVLPMAVVGADAAAGSEITFGSPSSVISETGRQGTFSGMACLSDHTWTRSSVRTATINFCTR